jgi:hypothetical protein
MRTKRQTTKWMPTTMYFRQQYTRSCVSSSGSSARGSALFASLGTIQWRSLVKRTRSEFGEGWRLIFIPRNHVFVIRTSELKEKIWRSQGLTVIRSSYSTAHPLRPASEASDGGARFTFGEESKACSTRGDYEGGISKLLSRWLRPILRFLVFTEEEWYVGPVSARRRSLRRPTLPILVYLDTGGLMTALGDQERSLKGWLFATNRSGVRVWG